MRKTVKGNLQETCLNLESSLYLPIMELHYIALAIVVATFAYLVGGRTLLKPMLAAYSTALSGAGNRQKKATAGQYTAVFPPSQRHTLIKALPLAKSHADNQSARAPTLLEIGSDYRFASASTRLYSGFTVGDIRTLGCFPDYAILSGVPAPQPLQNFTIGAAQARPYRPFRWPYHQTMCKSRNSSETKVMWLTTKLVPSALSKLDPDYWLELESSYEERLAQRQDLYRAHQKEILQALPGSELACKELMEMVLQFLSIRYPDHFQIKGNILVNSILTTEYDLTFADPLHILLDNIPEDFGIMMRDEESGRYHLRAGIICSSLGWKLGQKIGMGLSDIHEAVPSYENKMAFSMDRYVYSMIYKG